MANVGQLTATTASQTLLPYNNVRQALLIKNRQTNTDLVFVQFGTGITAVTATSFPLNIGESMWLTAGNANVRASALPDVVSILANSGTQDIRFIEF